MTPRTVTPELQRAIDDLYEAFPDQRGRAPIDGCPHCLDEEAARVLGTVERRAIPNDLLSRYAFKAITTWGDETVLRSLLPPVLAGLADGSVERDPQITFGKLTMVGAGAWPAAQRNAIERFLHAWMRAATQEDWGAAEIVECAAIAGFAIEPLLTIWEQASALESFSELADEILGSRWHFAEEGCDEARAVYERWLASAPARQVLRRAVDAHPNDEYACLWRDAIAK